MRIIPEYKYLHEEGTEGRHIFEFCPDRVFINKQGILYDSQVIKKPKNYPIDYTWIRRPTHESR